jgi:hypothetical protein
MIGDSAGQTAGLPLSNNTRKVFITKKTMAKKRSKKPSKIVGGWTPDFQFVKDFTDVKVHLYGARKIMRYFYDDGSNQYVQGVRAKLELVEPVIPGTGFYIRGHVVFVDDELHRDVPLERVIRDTYAVVFFHYSEFTGIFQTMSQGLAKYGRGRLYVAQVHSNDNLGEKFLISDIAFPIV